MYKTLKFVCSVLSFHGDQDQLRRKVEDIDNWPSVIQCSTHYLMAPAFYWSMKRREVLDAAPEDVRDYFEGIFELNRMRNKNLLSQTVELCRILNAVDIQPLLLKGMANVVDGLYEDPGLRTMGDIDIVIPHERIADCIAAMKSANYKCDSEDHLEHHLEPFYHEDYESTVEIHHKDIVTVEHSHILPVDEMWAESATYETDGAAMRIPSVNSRTLHNIVHAQLQHGYLDQQFVQQMYDMVLFMEVYGSKIDWEYVRARLDSAGRKRALGAYMSIAEKLFAQPKPTQCPSSPVRDQLSIRLHQASVSNLFVYGVSYLYYYYKSIIIRLFHNPKRRKIYRDKLKEHGPLHYLIKRIKAAFTNQP